MHLLALAMSAFATPTANVTADYTFALADPSDPVVECRLELRGLTGPTELALPERFAYASPPEPRLRRDVVLLGEGELARTGPFRWKLDPEGSSASLEWSVPIDHRSLPAAQRSAYEMPYVEADHGMLTGAVLAVGAVDLEDPTIRVRFELPEHWDVVAPWADAGDGTYAPESWTALADDYIAIGAWDVTRFETRGVEAIVGLAPGHGPWTSDVVEQVGAVVEAEVALFGRAPLDRYVFLFGRPGMSGLGGSTKKHSMTLLVGPELDAASVSERIVQLIAHEYHHTWILALQKPFDHEELHFVNEGFTDWYAHLVPWWLGFVDGASFLRNVEERLSVYEQSQFGADRSLVDAGGPAFFEDSRASTAVYAGGLALAALCDLAIQRRDEGRTLDELMRELHDGPDFDPSSDTGLADLQHLLAEYASEEFAAQVVEYARHRGTVDLVAAFAAIGVVLDRTEEPADLSRLRANFDGTTFRLIDSSDPARLLGLRTGDRLLRVNGVDVASEDDVRRAWARPVGGRVAVLYLRGAEERSLDLPVPPTVRFHLPDEVLNAWYRKPWEATE